jgi:fructokinase
MVGALTFAAVLLADVPARRRGYDLTMIVVAGENVVDLVPEADGLLRPTLGGGPANIAVAAARLKAPVAMVARLGADTFGDAFAARLADAGVETTYLVRSCDPSTLALASMVGDGSARFDFWLNGAADFGWRADELPELAVGDILHLGSLAAFLPPGADVLIDWATAHRPRGVVSVDPNLRRASLPHLHRLETLLACACVVKVSEDDLLLAYPDEDPEHVCQRWLETGRELVVLTRGGRGLIGFAAGQEVRVSPPVVTVVDTIGAGDTTMGALLTLISQIGLVGVLADLGAALHFAGTAGALACTRPGADPPSATELSAALRAA